MAELRNTYVNCQTEDGSVLPWEPPGVPEGAKPDGLYFSQVMVEMDRRLEEGGLTVYMTENREWLPSYGRDVVVLLTGDEFTRVPEYYGDVRAIFKNHAVRPVASTSFRRAPSWVNLWSLVWHLRTWKHHVRGVVGYRLRKRRGERAAPIWQLPIGVLDQVELPLKPLDERTRDVFFAGSIGHHRAGGLNERVNPKVLGRKSMVAHAERLAERHPELSVELVTTAAFLDSMEADAEAYSRSLMDARIALVPRGTVPDTFRFWQALRYGCVAIVDALPRENWFYDGAPVVRVERWDELEDVVPSLLADEARMQELHERSLEWWRTRGSPEAVGRFMAAKLDALGA